MYVLIFNKRKLQGESIPVQLKVSCSCWSGGPRDARLTDCRALI